MNGGTAKPSLSNGRRRSGCIDPNKTVEEVVFGSGTNLDCPEEPVYTNLKQFRQDNPQMNPVGQKMDQSFHPLASSSLIHPGFTTPVASSMTSPMDISAINYPQSTYFSHQNSGFQPPNPMWQPSLQRAPQRTMTMPYQRIPETPLLPPTSRYQPPLGQQPPQRERTFLQPPPQRERTFLQPPVLQQNSSLQHSRFYGPRGTPATSFPPTSSSCCPPISRQNLTASNPPAGGMFSQPPVNSASIPQYHSSSLNPSFDKSFQKRLENVENQLVQVNKTLKDQSIKPILSTDSFKIPELDELDDYSNLKSMLHTDENRIEGGRLEIDAFELDADHGLEKKQDGLENMKDRDDIRQTMFALQDLISLRPGGSLY